MNVIDYYSKLLGNNLLYFPLDGMVDMYALGAYAFIACEFESHRGNYKVVLIILLIIILLLFVNLSTTLYGSMGEWQTQKT